MRGTSAAKVKSRAAGASPAIDLDTLERHRDHHFRRVPKRRVAGEKSALAFIEEVGFCTGFTAGLGVPCLREAIAGEREPKIPEHLQHDYAIGMTWRISRNTRTAINTMSSASTVRIAAPRAAVCSA